MRVLSLLSSALFVAAALSFTACDPTTPTGPTPDPDPATEVEPDTEADTDPIEDPTDCAEADAAFDLALDRIQSCDTDDQCGQVLTGTSCGCTRDLVARNDADTTRFYELQSAMAELGCPGTVSTCDCPPADGFACVENTCTWDYQ